MWTIDTSLMRIGRHIAVFYKDNEPRGSVAVDIDEVELWTEWIEKLNKNATQRTRSNDE